MLDVFNTLFFVKLLTGIFAVLILTYTAENVSPKIAGVLAGFPLGTGITLFFVGVEHSANFAATSASSTMNGFVASLAFILGYYLIVKNSQNNLLNIVIASITALLFFIATAYLQSKISINLLVSTLVIVGCIFFINKYFKKILNTLVKKNKISLKSMVARSLISAFLILIVTTTASKVGTTWTGILAAFPITLFPFLIIIHLSSGKDAALTIVKNYPLGLGSLITYIIFVHFSYPIYGVYLGTCISLIASTCYSLILIKLLK